MQQNNGIFLCKNFARKIHHFFCSFALVLLLCLSPAYSAGYTCSTTKTYTSCKSSYYLSSSSCLSCPSGCTCAGGTAQPVCCSTSKSCSSSFSGYSGTYNECTQNQSSQCYKSCSVNCSGNDTSACPSNATCTYNTSYTHSGTQYYGGSCGATAGKCPVKSYTCNAGYYLSNGQCLVCTKGYYCDNGNRYACPSDYPLTDPRSEDYSNETSINGCWRDCNASDVPNSTARTGWREYSGNNTCTATACTAGYYLENGTCKQCPNGYTSESGTTGGIGSCYTTCTRACTQQTVPSGAYSVTHGTTSTSGIQYYGGTCSATASTCTLTINKCKTGYYKSNNSCGACPSDYPLTDNVGNEYSDEVNIGECWRYCNASDVPNSTARTGWREYSGRNICAATACAAGYALSSGTCVSCPSGYTSSSDMTNGTAYCYKTCPAKTGYTLTGGVDYYSATDTCAYSANCNAITIVPYCSNGADNIYLYKKTDTTGWYSNNTCTTTTTKTPVQLSTCSGWINWGVSPTQSDTTTDSSGSALYFTADGITTTAGTNWTVNTPATLYTVRARPCTNNTGCQCSLNISNTGDVDYSTSAKTGYTLTSGTNTYNPTCTVNTYSCAATQYLNGTTCQNCENGYYCSGGTWTYNGGIQGRNKCPSNYPLTDPQTATYSIETSINGCWRNCDTSDLPNAATYTGWKEYSGNNTCKILTCANGYGLTTTNECAQMCTTGITYLHIGTNIKIPLYASQHTTPSIHIKTNNTTCYANLATGADSGLNIKHNNITYHATN